MDLDNKNIRVDKLLWEKVKLEAAIKQITLTQYIHQILTNRNQHD